MPTQQERDRCAGTGRGQFPQDRVREPGGIEEVGREPLPRGGPEPEVGHEDARVPHHGVPELGEELHELGRGPAVGQGSNEGPHRAPLGAAARLHPPLLGEDPRPACRLPLQVVGEVGPDPPQEDELLLRVHQHLEDLLGARGGDHREDVPELRGQGRVEREELQLARGIDVELGPCRSGEFIARVPCAPQPGPDRVVPRQVPQRGGRGEEREIGGVEVVEHGVRGSRRCRGDEAVEQGIGQEERAAGGEVEEPLRPELADEGAEPSPERPRPRGIGLHLDPTPHPRLGAGGRHHHLVHLGMGHDAAKEGLG